ncbi:MAG: hypothetical protein KUF72_11045 [Candidatus Thiodiazotropha sp. (ex Ctena orbiculata)]|nr:hypothetical protein [Candidatus Thiodiazotropha taylori]
MSWFLSPKKTIKLYSPNSESVFLVFDDLDLRLPMKREENGYWSIKTSLSHSDINKLTYHFRVQENGQAKLLIDPTAKRMTLLSNGYKAYFTELKYHFRYNYFQTPPFYKIVIYETHLPALTRHTSARITNEDHRGTYLGACSEFVLDYLQKLNVAVEFLPLHVNNKELGQDWGYYSISYHSMRTDFAVNKENVNLEVMQLVDKLHGRKIPVILDVVFNHGAELWVKAWGKEVVYRKLENGEYCHGSGCGETVNTDNPHIRDSIIESLSYLVQRYRFDGFRFDLGALHDLETIIEIDRKLPNRIYLIAEPWALSGSRWGKQEMNTLLAKTRWSIWNDDFRESGRTFIKGEGDFHNRDLLMRSIAGSNIKDGGWTLRPQQSINYLSCHDGYTLADLVGNDKRRVFLGIFLVLTSQGIPMLGEGSEMLYSKKGHDNSYDRPDLNQLDWQLADQNRDLIEVVIRLIEIRRKLSHFHYTHHLKVNNHKSNDWNIDWIYPTGYPHHDNVNAIGYILRSPFRYLFWHPDHHPIIVLLNGSHTAADFQLPKGKWTVQIDGHELKAEGGEARTVRTCYHLHPGACALLVSS